MPSGELLTVDENSAVDTVVQILTACDSDCAASGSDTASFLNNTSDPVTIFVTVEAETAGPTGTYDVSLTRTPPDPGDLCVDPISIDATGADVPWTGTWADYQNSSDLDPANGCTFAQGRDVWFEVSVATGDKLTVSSSSGGGYPETVVHVVDSCGDAAICPFSSESIVSWYNETGAPATVLVAVEAVVSSVAGGPIGLVFATEAIPMGDACGTAHGVAPSPTYAETINLGSYSPSWPSDPGCAAAVGSDIWYEVDVPPEQVLFFDASSTADVVLYLDDECPVSSCLVDSDLSGAGGDEFLNWYNSSTVDTATVWAVAKAKDSGGSWADVDVTFTVSSATDGDFCSNAEPIDLTTTPTDTWVGDLSSFTDGFTGGAGCAGAVGPEVWFEVIVPADYWLNVTNGTSTAVNVQILESCSAGDCLASGGASQFWHNDDVSPTTVYVLVEGDSVTTGALDVAFEAMDAPATMFPAGGPTTATGMYWGATDDNVSMCPDITTTGSLLSTLSDDSYAAVSLGIDFDFFGVSYGTTDVINVNSNGIMSFVTGTSSLGGGPMPYSAYAFPIIATYWDDLNPTYGGGVYTQVIGDTFVVNYNIAPHGSSGTYGNYDVRVVLDGSTNIIHTCYIDTHLGTSGDDGIDATAGIQGSGTIGLGFSDNSAVLLDGLHVY